MLKQYAVKVRNNNLAIMDLLGNLIESRELERSDHINRIKEYTRYIATALMELYPEYELTKKKIETIISASVLHDIGKISIPDSVLLKPGKLTDVGFTIIKSHTVFGGDLIEQFTDIWGPDLRKTGYDIAMYHHERYDVRGYPKGLVGEDIPISAQIVSIADV